MHVRQGEYAFRTVADPARRANSPPRRGTVRFVSLLARRSRVARDILRDLAQGPRFLATSSSILRRWPKTAAPCCCHIRTGIAAPHPFSRTRTEGPLRRRGRAGLCSLFFSPPPPGQRAPPPPRKKGEDGPIFPGGMCQKQGAAV